jgi:hypothetical protein
VVQGPYQGYFGGERSRRIKFSDYQRDRHTDDLSSHEHGPVLDQSQLEKYTTILIRGDAKTYTGDRQVIEHVNCIY